MSDAHNGAYTLKPSLIFMFSGQGSQYFQMGKELYTEHPVFRRVVDQGDALARRQLGTCLAAEIYGRPSDEPFDDLRLSHPALLIIQYAMLRTLISEGIEPNQVLGSSLGELIAAVAAGVWSFESALDAVVEQARLVASTCPPGGMLAVLHGVELYSELVSDGCDVTLAGINFNTHFTVSGNAASLDEVQNILKLRRVAFHRLPVGYAFHSAAIDGIKQPFVRFCGGLPINRTPLIPVLSGASGEIVSDVTPEYFWTVVRGPMHFRNAVRYLEHRAASVFIDCGPSGTLATFVKYNLANSSGSTSFPMLSPFHRTKQQFRRLKECVAQRT